METQVNILRITLKNKNIGKVGPDEIMLRWHMEHIYSDNPIIAATWNMINFNTDNNNGKTYFVDSEQVYKMMPNEWKNFLEKCTLNWNEAGINNFQIVKNHWITKNKVFRIRINSDKELIKESFLVDNNIPSHEEIKLFEEIVVWFANQVMNNEDIRIVHKWKQGDIVIPDMFKLAHAVTGGFDSIDRKFIGIWGYKDNM